MIFNLGLLCLICSIGINYASLNVRYVWKYIDYVWEDSLQKSEAIDRGRYNLTKNIPYDVDQAPDGRIFVTVVKDVGVPASLTTVSNETGDGGNLLRPYPDWSWHTKNDCSGITGVYRVAISCNNLWVLDCGKIGENQKCPAKLLVFDLSNDKLVKRVIIPSDYATNANGTGLLVTPVVESRYTGCETAPHLSYVYMADTEGYGMVIWNGRELARIESEYFEPEESATNFEVAGESFYLADGILGMAIEKGRTFRTRRLYFRALASLSMSYVRTAFFKLPNKRPSRIPYHREPNKIRSQSAAQAFSRSGILFYSSSSEQSMICWNRRKPFNDENNVQFAIDEETLQFASGVKVVDDESSELLYVMTNRYQKVINGVIDFTDNNFRILSGTVDELVKNTNCE